MREKEFLKTTHLIDYPILKRLLNDIVEKDFTYCVYFDTRNLLPIHKPYQQVPILQKARQDQYLIAKTLMHLASYWAKFFDEMGVEFIFFFDDNQNYSYHFDLYPEYKYKRIERKKRYAKSMGKKYTMFQKLYRKNIRTISKSFLPFRNAFYIPLEDIESDFIPYFCMEEFFTAPCYKHIILSGDKDFSQLLSNPHTYQIIQKGTTYSIRNKENALSHLLKDPCRELHYLKDPVFFSLALNWR